MDTSKVSSAIQQKVVSVMVQLKFPSSILQDQVKSLMVIASILLVVGGMALASVIFLSSSGSLMESIGEMLRFSPERQDVGWSDISRSARPTTGTWGHSPSGASTVATLLTSVPLSIAGLSAQCVYCAASTSERAKIQAKQVFFGGSNSKAEAHRIFTAITPSPLSGKSSQSCGGVCLLDSNCVQTTNNREFGEHLRDLRRLEPATVALSLTHANMPLKWSRNKRLKGC